VQQALLAVDLGLRTGLALFGGDGRLQWYRSQNFGTAARLRRGVYHLLSVHSDVNWLVLEGGGNLAEIWEREAKRRGIPALRIGAERWRQRLLYDREQRSGSAAKHYADALARSIVDWSGASRPTSLRHDAAEAILVGLWGVLEVGWLEQVPPSVRRNVP
jgi:hypothetical protein